MSTEGAAEQRIRALAAQHGIVAERLSLDDWADKVTELSGDAVLPDLIQDLVVTLRRKGVITGKEAVDLYAEYLRQSGGAG
ncbi:hypothetical protein N4E75_004354 [Salmonella enterica]|nr:hypothetical protein [Salmonella enterica]